MGLLDLYEDKVARTVQPHEGIQLPSYWELHRSEFLICAACLAAALAVGAIIHARSALRQHLILILSMGLSAWQSLRGAGVAFWLEIEELASKRKNR